MGLRIEKGFGIRTKLYTGCGIKSSSRDRDTRFSTVTPNDNHLFDRIYNLYISGLPVTYNQ